ncbi:MAG: flavoprotein [Planctomycetota bacterium]|nr:flavoprotein [Planctomycetota bacterium]
MTDQSARIVVGVGGSIAAWKACDLVSKLVQAGHEVDVVMSAAAERFVRPLAFSALTHKPVLTNDLWFEAEGAAAHLRICDAADLFVVAPCTANQIGKFAHGIADEIVSTTYLGATCPVLIAPAMHHRMWASKRVQANVAILKADGVELVGPASGYLAEGDQGPGRMSEPAEILQRIADLRPGA